MLDLSFGVLVLMPSMAFAYSVLYTFYGWRRAYESISWVPAALWVSISLFLPMHDYAPATGLNLLQLLSAVEWTSFLQMLLGVWLISLALRQREPLLLLTLATVLTGLPFLARAMA